MIKGVIKNVESALKKIDKVQTEILSGQVKAVQLSTLLIHEYAVKIIQQVGDGTPQIRYSPKRVVNVSKPGDPPNSDTGRLVQSIKFDFKKAGLIGRVGSNLRYAAHLEFGTLNMDPRPWLSEAVSQTSNEVADIFNEQTELAIKAVVK
jgi:HK97 gp10 family phage protein